MFRSASKIFSSVLIALVVVSSPSLLSAAWVNATGNLANMASECGDLQSIYAIPNVNLTVTGVANNGIYATSNGGTSWTKLTGLATMRMMQMLFDPDHPDTWYAGGIYHTPGIVKTTDAGATWVGFDGIGTNDGFAVDFSDANRQTLLAGGHESQSNLYRSANGGTTWTNIGCPGGGYSSFPYIVNTQTYLMGIQSVGMYRSVNAGANWTQVSSTAPLSHITKTAAGDLYYTGGGRVVRSTDNGATWTTLQTVSVAGAAPIEVPGGKIAVINSQGIAISADKGATWTSNRCRPLPAPISGFWAFNVGIGLTYNSVAGSFWTFHWGCGSSVAADAIWRFDTLIGSSDIIMPDHQALSRSDLLTNLPENAAVYDVLGKSLGHLPYNRSRMTANRVFFVKAPNGRIIRQICREQRN